jgi:hypothetical protein
LTIDKKVVNQSSIVSMKLCRYWNPDSGPALGLVGGDRVYNLNSADPQHFGLFALF